MSEVSDPASLVHTLQSAFDDAHWCRQFTGVESQIGALLVSDRRDELFPAEDSVVSKAVDSRVAEFSSGRHCARQQMNQLGRASLPILAGEDRAPIWPVGLTGSISHTRDIAVAALAELNRVACIGIDLEHAQRVRLDVMRLVASPTEREWLESNETPDWAAAAVFSIKESVFKCWNPLIRQFFGFKSVELDLDALMPVALLPAESSAYPLPQTASGRHPHIIELSFRVVDDSLLCALQACRAVLQHRARLVYVDGHVLSVVVALPQTMQQQ